MILPILLVRFSNSEQGIEIQITNRTIWFNYFSAQFKTIEGLYIQRVMKYKTHSNIYYLVLANAFRHQIDTNFP